jgi:hypothetical protein
MKTDLDNLAHRVKGVETNAKGRRCYDQALRDDVIAAFHDAKLCMTDYAARIGIPATRIRIWMEKGQVRRAASPKRSFKKIGTVDFADRTFRLRGPYGFEVDGLTFADVVAIMRALKEGDAC